MRREDFYFESRDAGSKLHGVRWIPDGTPVGVLQIVHGMAEHVDRYEDFATFMTSKGFVVAAEDHLGHGKSIQDNKPGYFCKQDPATVVVRDVHRLKKSTQDLFPGIPYYILGHSMGSFILRNYLFRYGKGIDGAIIMGTGSQPKGMVAALKVLAGMACFFGKASKPCNMINVICFGSYLKTIENLRTRYDWLSKDEAVVDKYIADPLCGFTFPGNGFKTMAELLWRLTKPSNLSKMPVTLRVLITSGAKDPVGDCGIGPKKVYDSFIAEGMQRVDLKLYDNDRHEILNETDHMTVYEDIYSWITKEA